MAVRNVEGANARAASMRVEVAGRGGSLRVASLDLADLGSVRAFAAQMVRTHWRS
jgi:hypothetical protein